LAEWVSTIAALSVFVGRRLPGGKAQMVVPAYTYVNSQPTLRRDVTGLSDCSDFVDLLVARGADYKKCWFFRKCRLGYEIAESYGGLGPGIDYPRAKVPSIPTGFWPFLTMGGQGSEVYRHIAGSVGALLCGAESRWEAQVRSDWRQYQDSGELERLAEILDDYAGFMVASVLGSFVDCSMTQEQAKFALDLILCEPGFVTWFRQMFREYSK
jgi:hypothetical protein